MTTGGSHIQQHAGVPGYIIANHVQETEPPQPRFVDPN